MATFPPIELSVRWLKQTSRVLDIRPLKMDFTIELAGKQDVKADATQIGNAKKAAGRAEAKLSRRVNTAVDELVQFANEQHQADLAAPNGVANAYRDVSNRVEQTNRLIKKYVQELPIELRRAIGQAIGVEPKQLVTKRTESITEIAVRVGMFKQEEGDSNEDFEDLEKLLTRFKADGWLFCAVAANGTKACIMVDPKRPVKRTVADKLRKHVGGSALKIKGICNVNGKKLEFYFEEKSKKKPKKVHIMSGLSEQIDKNYRVTKVAFTLSAMPANKEELKRAGDSLSGGGESKSEGPQK